MKVLVLSITGLFLMLLQASISFHFSIDLFKPDFAIPLVIYVTFFMGAGPGFVTVLCVGFIEESLSIAPAGSIMFVLVSIFLITTFMKNKLYIDSRYSFAAVSSVAIVLESLLILMLSLLARGEAPNALHILLYAIPSALSTGLVSLFIYTFIEYLNAAYLDRE
ncbi:MAG TPA: hypothetical protein VMT62_03550 [Syntrophorhabdaceae bacterium]|nr:hypothetical protein [Syntrophorhabdaceae bacterium]